MNFFCYASHLYMPAMGLEPIRGCPQQILSLPRLPFRHAGLVVFNSRNIYYHTRQKESSKRTIKNR